MITYAKSRRGTISRINDVDIFASVTSDSKHIKNPYTDFPAEPVMIFCGGRANMKKIIIPPVINILIVEENTDPNLVPIMKIKRKMIIEFPSIIPGEPAVHLNALIHAIIQKIITKSPGNTKDCCNPSIENSQVKASSGRLIIERFVKSMIEKARIMDARSW